VAPRAHAPALALSLLVFGSAAAQQPPRANTGPEEQTPVTEVALPAPQSPAPTPAQRSRLGAWQLHMHVLLGVEPVDHVNAVAFGTSAELLWRCRVGLFAGLLSSKGNANIAANIDGVVQPAAADRISIPFGIAIRPFGHLGMIAGTGARGWAQRLAAGIGLEVGPTIEHLRDSGSSKTVGGLHLALGLDVPLWGGPVEGGVMLRFVGRMTATPAVSLEIQSDTHNALIHMPAVGGQFYGGIAWAL